MLGVNFGISGMLHGFATRIYVCNIIQSIVTLLFHNKTEGMHYLLCFTIIKWPFSLKSVLNRSWKWNASDSIFN